VPVLQLYLIRHGIAVDRSEAGEDSQRPLTPQGREKTQRVARRLRQLDLYFDHLLSSPLVRARQTAEIFLAAGLAPRLEVASALAPQGSFSQWLTWLEDWRQAGHGSLALVGHQPDLTQWAELLLWGEARSALILKKAGIIGITLPAAEPPIGSSQLFWLAPPKLLL